MLASVFEKKSDTVDSGQDWTVMSLFSCLCPHSSEYIPTHDGATPTTPTALEIGPSWFFFYWKNPS